MTIGVVCWVGWPTISPIKISSLDLLPNHFFRFNSPLYQVSYGCSHVCKKKLSRDTTKLPYIIYVTLKYFYLYMSIWKMSWTQLLIYTTIFVTILTWLLWKVKKKWLDDVKVIYSYSQSITLRTNYNLFTCDLAEI